METMLISTTLVRMTCGACGIPFAMPEDLYDEAQRHRGKNWYCPNGHSRVFAKTVEEKLREAEERLDEERRRARATRDLLRAEERSHAATRGHLTRTKRRVSHGVCPCCNRSFANVERHMKTKHPEYVADS